MPKQQERSRTAYQSAEPRGVDVPIRSTSNPIRSMTSEQKAALDRIVQKTQTKDAAYWSSSQAAVQQPTLQRPVGSRQNVPVRQSSQNPPSRYSQQSRQAQQNRSRTSASNTTVNTRRRAKKRKKVSAKKVLLTLLILTLVSAVSFGVWYFWWTEYATFEYSLQPVVILEGQSIMAEDFVYPNEDAEFITAAFQRQEFRSVDGKQDVLLTLTRGWRSLNTVASLRILTPLSTIEHEFRESALPLQAIDLLANPEAASGVPYSVDFIEDPLPLSDYEVGEYTLLLTLNGAPFSVNLIITDTTPPEATAVNVTVSIGTEVSPEDFVADVSDVSLPVTISFIEAPDVFAPRDQIVEVRVEDVYGNYTDVQSGLTILRNQSAPTINGADTIISVLGDRILYRQGVTAVDDFGTDLTERIVIDNSEVDVNSEGIYNVTFSVEDYSGRSSEVTVEVHILDIDIAFVYEEVDKVLSSIINNGMTELQKVRAIHAWIISNINYANMRGGPATAEEGAYRALKDRRGNCYIFYSLAEIMLTRANVPNMRIERIAGTPTNHRWNLVNPDGLGWHHFDAFPTRLIMGTVPMAFFTGAQAENFTRLMSQLEERPTRNYYTYDKELYPEVVRG